MLEHSDGKYEKCPHCTHIGLKKDSSKHIQVNLLFSTDSNLNEFDYFSIFLFLKENHGTVICDLCGKVFTNRKHYETHYSGYHRMYKCKNCGKEYQGYKDYQVHMREHIGNLVCDVCGEEYKVLNIETSKSLFLLNLKFFNLSCRIAGCSSCTRRVATPLRGSISINARFVPRDLSDSTSTRGT